MASLSTLISSSLSQGLVTKSAAPLFNPLMASCTSAKAVMSTTGMWAWSRRKVRSQSKPSCPLFTPSEKFMSSRMRSTCSCCSSVGAVSGRGRVRIRSNVLPRQIFSAVSIDGLSSITRRVPYFISFIFLFAKVRFFPETTNKNGIVV